MSIDISLKISTHCVLSCHSFSEDRQLGYVCAVIKCMPTSHDGSVRFSIASTPTGGHSSVQCLLDKLPSCIQIKGLKENKLTLR